MRFLATIYRIWMMRHVDVPEEVSSALMKQLQGEKQQGQQRAKKNEDRKKARSKEPEKRAKPKYIPVVAVVNGRSARTTLVPAGAGRYRLQINTEQRKAARADAGELIGVEVRLDLASRELPIPADLRAGLDGHPKARKAFEALPPGQRRQFLQWFDSAKAPETRRKRLVRAIDILLERALLSRRRNAKPPNDRGNSEKPRRKDPDVLR